MKAIIISVCIIILSPSTSYPQKIEDVGAGIINFLLRNPKTADKMQADQRIALDIIGDLLKTEGQRQHELEYAAAGRNQITINTNDGRQAQFVRNETGRVFLLYDGVIYPISTQLVNQSLGIESNSYSPPPSTDLEKTRDKYLSNYQNHDQIGVIFAYKWWRDFNEDGVSNFDEFRQIKKEFYDNENFQIAIAYNASKETEMTIEIIDDYSGKSKFLNNWKVQSGSKLYRYDIPSGLLPMGNYVVYAKLKVLNLYGPDTYSTSTERIQIIEGNKQTREASIWEENYKKSMVSNSTPTGIFFWSSWNDENGDGKYDANEFTGLNKQFYSLGRDSIHVGINFPQKSGELILQSWTKQGKLLGTTTLNYQQVFTRWTWPGSDPYQFADFMDMIKISGPGEYKITVSFVDGGMYEKKLLTSK